MRRAIGCLAMLLMVPSAWAGELSVGPGKTYATIADALAKAVPGDTILVYPPPAGAAYQNVVVMVRKENITIKAVPAAPRGRVALCGKGFNYTGAGGTPRAIFQFDPQANFCVLDGFELFDAHNDSSNGAGVRINQANNVTIRNCDIHDCDMGVMSNGDGTASAGANQRFESCLIHSNGSLKQAGYNHNLYLGGASVTLSACEVHSSLTGHNVKSRAHFTRVEYSYIHDSANREFDLVDAKGDTTAPHSDAVLLGNVIVKSPSCGGNRTTIHFGQDGGNERDGTIYLVHNTIVTPFISPVVDLSAAKAGAKFINNIIWDGRSGQQNQALVRLGKGCSPDAASGLCNWLSSGWASAGAEFRATYLAKAGENPAFVDPARRDFHLASASASIVAAGEPWASIVLPATPGAEPSKAPPPLRECKSPLSTQDRPGFKASAKADLGAFGFDAKAGR